MSTFSASWLPASPWCFLAKKETANNKYQQSPSATIIDNEPQKIIAVFVDGDYHVCVYFMLSIDNDHNYITRYHNHRSKNQQQHQPLASAFGTTATFSLCGRGGGQTKSSQPPRAMYGWWSTEMVFKTDNVWLGTSIELIWTNHEVGDVTPSARTSIGTHQRKRSKLPSGNLT